MSLDDSDWRDEIESAVEFLSLIDIDDRLILRQITDEVMFEIGELSGQTYVDVYSGEPLPDEAPPLDLDRPPVPEPAAVASA